jgi:hypothetical protein
MKFILRKDKVLVLKGRDLIRFQCSDPQQITFSYNGKAYAVMADQKKKLKTFEKTATLIFPPEMTEKSEEPFPGEKPLPTVVPPSSRPASASPGSNSEVIHTQ